MMRFERMVWAVWMLAAAAVPGVAAAQHVAVTNAWARASVPGQKTAAVYLELTSDLDAAVVAVRSASAERAELHSMTVQNGVMRMRTLARIDLPAGETVKLAPAGTHVMLIDLKRPLNPGDKVPLELNVQPAGAPRVTLRFEAEVRELGVAAPKKHRSH